MELKQEQPYVMPFVGTPPPSPRTVRIFLDDDESSVQSIGASDTLYSSLLSSIQAERKRNHERLEQLRRRRRRCSQNDSQKENLTSRMDSAITRFESAVQKLVSSSLEQDEEEELQITRLESKSREQAIETNERQNEASLALLKRVRKLEGLLEEKSSECEALKKQIQRLTPAGNDNHKEEPLSTVELPQAAEESNEVDSSAVLTEPCKTQNLYTLSALGRSNSFALVSHRSSNTNSWSKALLPIGGSSSFLMIGELVSTPPKAIEKTEQQEESDQPSLDVSVSNNFVLLPPAVPRVGLVPLQRQQNISLCSLPTVKKGSGRLWYVPTNLVGLSAAGQILQTFGNPSSCATQRSDEVDHPLHGVPNSIPEPLPVLAQSPKDEQHEDTCSPSSQLRFSFGRIRRRPSLMLPSASSLTLIGHGKPALSLCLQAAASFSQQS